ncbi:MAG: rubrerythrin family protein [Candidatus Njordarchaeales archaeon]
MKLTTQEILMSAFAGESQAHMRYLHFAEIAEKEGFPNVARLFRAVAFSEQVHAINHLKNLGHLKGGFLTVAHATFGPGNTSKNLELAIMGEEYEVEEMYPIYIEIAKMQNEKRAEMSFRWALESEKRHAELYRKAKETVDSGKDAPFGKIYVCGVCGYTVEGEVPDRCPVCGAPKEKFKEF